MRRLSALLEEADRPVPPLGLSRMIRAERRVDVDELAALAAVLGVSTDVLLAPPGEAAGDSLPEHARRGCGPPARRPRRGPARGGG
jgi:hypothetical protein